VRCGHTLAESDPWFLACEIAGIPIKGRYNPPVMLNSGRGRARLAFAAGCALIVMASPSAAQVPATQAAVAQTAQAPRVAAVVKTVTGSALLVRSGQELPVKPGLQVAEGDTIKTSADGRVGLTFKDGTRLALGGNTELRVDTFTYAPAQKQLGMVVKLLRGLVEYVSGHIAQLAPGAVKVETPTSVIGIRGTRLLIAVDQP
jgi:FecR protein